ncbi:MAG: glycosyltransferase family 9 protein [Acidobacteria bacterium]|nr:glycosyltransferase family 9 protein [Acidobacteriota bacterium]
MTGLITLQPDARLSGRWKALAEIRRRRPKLCLNLHGGSTSAWLTALSGARWRAGFAHFRHGAAYNLKIPRAQEILGLAPGAPVHTAQHLASAMFYLGAPAGDIPAAKLFAAETPRAGSYAVLHIGAGYFTKQWPAERFAALAHWLRGMQGLEPVIVASPGQGELLAPIREFEAFDDLAIGEMMALLKGAQLFVGNDSGPAHVAAAFGVPCVVIFGSSNSQVWYPWKTRYQVVETEWPCKPCPGDRCYAFDQPRCILSVEFEAVERAVIGVLARQPTFSS